MFRCIYCPTESQRKFPPEHVIPKGLGRFNQNLTLFSVCGDCNAFFGEGLERQLQRDSILALWRLGSGLKPPHEAGQIGGRRLKTVVSLGALKGAPIRFAESAGRIVPDHEPLVGFQNSAGEFDWYRATELTSETVAKYDPWPTVKIYGSRDQIDRLRAYLGDVGVPLTSEGGATPTPASLDVTSSFTIDDDTLRVIGKIAFNYAARFLPAGFLLHSDFDDYRNYVRHGIRPPQPVVRPIDDLILASEAEQRAAERNHLITMDWDWSHRQIVVSVSLFNSMPVEAILCPNYHGVWFPIASGHLFKYATKRIVRLVALPRNRST